MINKCEEVWSQCLSIIRENLTKTAYVTWFEPIKALSIEDNTLVLQVPSVFFYEYIEDQYLDLLSKTLRRVIGEGARLRYKALVSEGVDDKSVTISLPQGRVKPKNPSMPVPRQPQEPVNPFAIPGIKRLQIDPQLNTEYSFDNFVEGECNRLARAAGFTVANDLAGTFNPLFIYGVSGTGKTHLVNAIGLEVKAHFPEKVVLYVDTNTFQTQYMQAARDNNINDFIHFYQMIDVLILDDVQYLSDKVGTQKAFFNIFNYLHQSKKQLILTSDKPPVELSGIEERLLSRFKWGMTADLQEPDFETRIKILKAKAAKDDIRIKEEILEYIASHITNNVRELEGALISLLASATLNKKEITLELAKGMIDRLVKNTQREISIDYIQKVVCNYFDMPVDALSSKTRKREIVQARQIAMFFAREMTKLSLAAIGASIGGKDHATVLHACNTVNNLVDTDKKFKLDLEEIEKRLKM